MASPFFFVGLGGGGNKSSTRCVPYLESAWVQVFDLRNSSCVPMFGCGSLMFRALADPFWGKRYSEGKTII